MTIDQFVTKYTGKPVEYHSYSSAAKNQCVDLANQYIVEVLGLPAIIGTNAQDFPSKKGTNYDYILNSPSGVPTKGDLMIFSSADKVGHISIFLEGNTTSFRSFDQNYPTGSLCKVVQHTYKNVLGWLHPRKEVMANELETCMADRLKFWQERDVALLKIKELEIEVARLKGDIANHKCPTTTSVDLATWELNGLNITEGNKTFNYKKRA